MIRAIIFDCFGVLISDALSVMVSGIEATDPEGAAEIHRLIHLVSRGMIDADTSNQQIAQLLGMSTDEYRQHVNDGEVKDQALLIYIQGLKQHYKIGVLSNISNGGIARRFTPDELERYFDAVVASGEVGYAKPEAGAYELIADRLDVRLDECVFTDDREDYCEGARAVGMQAILYRDFAQFRTELEVLLADAQQ